MRSSGRLFEVILYPDSSSYDFLEKIDDFQNYCDSHSYSYYWIIHDKDEGVKKHCHFLMYTNGSPTTIKKLSKDLYLDENMIEMKDLLSSSIRYLCHVSTNSNDKFQYDWHDINTNDMVRVKKLYENLDENNYIKYFINFIDEHDIIYYRDFVNFVLDNNLWSYYRRSASIIKFLIDEHNMFLCEKAKCKEVKKD